MTRFLDGPAEGQVLMLKRAPIYLRAVRSADGKWDALDQLDDVPRSGETIAVYKLEGEPTMCHINRARSAGGGGFFRGGAYRVVAEQPSDDQVRSTAAWRAWVGEKVGRPVDADGVVQ